MTSRIILFFNLAASWFLQHPWYGVITFVNNLQQDKKLLFYAVIAPLDNFL